MALSNKQIEQAVESYRSFLHKLNEHPDPSQEAGRQALTAYVCDGDRTQGWAWTALMKLAWVAGLTFVSSDALLYHFDGEFVRILTGFRKGNPWDGYLTLAFGGYVDCRKDVDSREAASREIIEETGVNGEVSDMCSAFRGFNVASIYGLLCETGPYDRWHHTVAFSNNTTEGLPVRLSITLPIRPAHTNPVLAKVYLFQFPRVYENKRGTITNNISDTIEQHDLMWRTPAEIVRDFGDRLAFDQAVPLYEFISTSLEHEFTPAQLGF